jgi:hypothetical protein
VRERRVPDWTAVREALERWDEEERTQEGGPGPFVRNGAGLLLEALEEFSRGLDSGSRSRSHAADDD